MPEQTIEVPHNYALVYVTISKALLNEEDLKKIQPIVAAEVDRQIEKLVRG